MGTPDARFRERLQDAYDRYQSARQSARPGTSAASKLARARLDLVLLLEEDGEPLAEELAAQISLDSDELLRTTPPLT